MKTMGIGMEGFENVIEMLAKSVLRRFRTCDYLEIGVASGRTLGAVANLLKESGRPWTATGVDIENGWSLNLPEVESSLSGIPWKQGAGAPEQDSCLVSLEGSAIAVPKLPRVHLAMIDGCHEFACVAADYEAVLSRVPNGGFILFHDAGQDQNGGGVQPHKGEPIRVWDFLDGSGLLREGYLLRGDWRLENPISLFVLPV